MIIIKLNYCATPTAVGDALVRVRVSYASSCVGGRHASSSSFGCCGEAQRPWAMALAHAIWKGTVKSNKKKQ